MLFIIVALLVVGKCAGETLPGPPASVALSVVAEDKLGITINAPEDDGGAHVTHYRVDVYPASPCVSAKTSGSAGR